MDSHQKVILTMSAGNPAHARHIENWKKPEAMIQRFLFSS
jgi:hypothetical protein